MTSDRYQHQRYLWMTLDPLHPGAGGYRLGRVDNSIAREPGTRLPKIPGSSLHGAARAYAAYLYGTPEAAGQNQGKIDEPEANPVCYSFGYLKKDQTRSGVVNIFDTHLLFFPVHSARGPVWVSTAQRLRDSGFELENIPEAWDEDKMLTTLKDCKRLNLGWLMLETAPDLIQIEPPAEWKGAAEWQALAERIALVSDALFSHIVNSNLEVRTSVAIDPHTGAADDGALYTYEAIPRAAFLTTEVVLDDYAQQFPSNERWDNPLDVVEAGLKMIEYLSVGGMGTRGFGRMRIVGTPIVKSQHDIFGAGGQEV